MTSLIFPIMSIILNVKQKKNGNEFENLYTFLQTAEEREVVSVEERSLELFGHEKFLQDSELFPEGKGFLTRIGIPEEKLKMVKLRRAFCILDETRKRN